MWTKTRSRRILQTSARLATLSQTEPGSWMMMTAMKNILLPRWDSGNETKKSTWSLLRSQSRRCCRRRWCAACPSPPGSCSRQILVTRWEFTQKKPFLYRLHPHPNNQESLPGTVHIYLHFHVFEHVDTLWTIICKLLQWWHQVDTPRPAAKKLLCSMCKKVFLSRWVDFQSKYHILLLKSDI